MNVPMPMTTDAPKTMYSIILDYRVGLVFQSAEYAGNNAATTHNAGATAPQNHDFIVRQRNETARNTRKKRRAHDRQDRIESSSLDINTIFLCHASKHTCSSLPAL